METKGLQKNSGISGINVILFGSLLNPLSAIVAEYLKSTGQLRLLITEDALAIPGYWV